MAYLVAIGCNELQGYLLGRPAPPATVDALLGVVRTFLVDEDEVVAA